MSEMRITFLGTGGGMPSKKRNLPAIAVRTSNALTILDCGEGTQRQMIYAGLGMKEEIHVFVTHLHGDHVLGIPGLLFTLSMNMRKNDVFVHGPEGISDFLKAVLRPQLGVLGFRVVVDEIGPGDRVRVGNLTVEAFKTDHTHNSQGYVIEEDPRPGRMREDYLEKLGVPRGPLWGMLQRGKPIEFAGRKITPEEAVGPPRPGRKVVYTGDTRPSETILEAAEGADVLIHDATFDSRLADKALEEKHSTALEAAKTAAAAQVRRLYLFHISPRYEDASILLNEAREVFPESYVAEDLESYAVPFR
jgi:ribonuclease Z